MQQGHLIDIVLEVPARGLAISLFFRLAGDPSSRGSFASPCRAPFQCARSCKSILCVGSSLYGHLQAYFEQLSSNAARQPEHGCARQLFFSFREEVRSCKSELAFSGRPSSSNLDSFRHGVSHVREMAYRVTPSVQRVAWEVASAWSSPCRAYPKAAPDLGLLFAAA